MFGLVCCAVFILLQFHVLVLTQRILNYMQMNASDVGHLAYDRVVFRRAIKGAKLHQGHSTE
jgi:hypothetical protein